MVAEGDAVGGIVVGENVGVSAVGLVAGSAVVVTGPVYLSMLVVSMTDNTGRVIGSFVLGSSSWSSSSSFR